jgi:hypothetical protein
MLCHIFQDCVERSNSEGRMPGDRDVMYAALLCGESHVAPGLAREFVSVPTKQRGELFAA